MLDYLLTIRQNLRYCTETEDLQEIRFELVSLGLIKENTSKKQKELPVKPLKYNVHGFCVYVGKNNVQNNHVTFKIAKTTTSATHAKDTLFPRDNSSGRQKRSRRGNCRSGRNLRILFPSVGRKQNSRRLHAKAKRQKTAALSSRVCCVQHLQHVVGKSQPPHGMAGTTVTATSSNFWYKVGQHKVSIFH